MTLTAGAKRNNVFALPRANEWRTTTSPWSPDQIPIPFPGSQTLLPAPVERGPVAAGELRQRCGIFAQAIAEVLTGLRPPRQLTPWLTREVHDQLARHSAETYRGAIGRSKHRTRVVSLHLSMVDANGAEIAARMVHRGRSRAIAFRLQHITDNRGRAVWRCTALEWA